MIPALMILVLAVAALGIAVHDARTARADEQHRLMESALCSGTLCDIAPSA